MRQRFAIILCCDNDETERNFGQVILMIFAKGLRPVIKSFNKHDHCLDEIFQIYILFLTLFLPFLMSNCVDAISKELFIHTSFDKSLIFRLVPVIINHEF